MRHLKSSLTSILAASLVVSGITLAIPANAAFFSDNSTASSTNRTQSRPSTSYKPPPYQSPAPSATGMTRPKAEEPRTAPSAMGMTRPPLAAPSTQQQPTPPAAAQQTPQTAPAAPSAMGMSRPPLPGMAQAPQNQSAPAESAMGMTRPPLAPQPPPSPYAPAGSAMGMARPSLQQQTPQTTAPSALGMTRPPLPAATPRAMTQTTPPAQGSLDQKASLAASKAAMDKYKAEQAAAKVPPQPVNVAAVKQDPVYSSARSRWGNADNYWAERDRAMSQFTAQQPPQVVLLQQRLSPNYGMWSTVFLTALLTHEADSAYSDWAYAHRADPGYVAWHQQALAQSADNAQMRAEIAQLDAKVAQLQAQNAPVNASALPAGVPAALAIAPQAVMADVGVTPAPSSSHWLLWTILVAILIVLGLSVVLVRNRRTA